MPSDSANRCQTPRDSVKKKCQTPRDSVKKKCQGFWTLPGFCEKNKWTPRDSKTEILDSNGVLGEKVRLRSTPKKLDAAGL